jgi:hypothetical protein
MKRKRFSVEQIVAVLKQAEAGLPVADLIRQVGISEQTYYLYGLLPFCKRKFANGLNRDRLQTSIRRHPPKWSAPMGRPPTHASIAGRPRRPR